MTRELKFRAWDRNEKRMFSMSEMPYFDSEYQDFNFSVDFNEKDEIKADDIRWRVDSDNWELMQYTGLKDRNGKEIYEGDVVKRESEKWGWKIIWDEGSAGFSMQYIFDRTTKDLTFVGDSFDVIGNIYENKDLLKNYEI